MPIIFSEKTGMVKNGYSHAEAMSALAQAIAAQRASTITAMTDSSGGTAADLNIPDTAVNVANTGSNLADKTTTEAALNTVLDAVRELYAKANAIAAVVGVAQITYNGGGTAPDGTISAITTSVTGATTGVQATNINATYTALNGAIYNLGALTNKIADAVGIANVGFNAAFTGTPASTISAITIAGGTAASPGVTKAQIDAALVRYAANVKKLATAINAARALPVPNFVVA